MPDTGSTRLDQTRADFKQFTAIGIFHIVGFLYPTGRPTNLTTKVVKCPPKAVTTISEIFLTAVLFLFQSSAQCSPSVAPLLSSSPSSSVSASLPLHWMTYDLFGLLSLAHHFPWTFGYKCFHGFGAARALSPDINSLCLQNPQKHCSFQPGQKGSFLYSFNIIECARYYFKHWEYISEVN